MTATAQGPPTRGPLATYYALSCDMCLRPMPAKRTDQRYCSNACKQRAWRQGIAKPTPSKRRAWIAE